MTGPQLGIVRLAPKALLVLLQGGRSVPSKHFHCLDRSLKRHSTGTRGLRIPSDFMDFVQILGFQTSCCLTSLPPPLTSHLKAYHNCTACAGTGTTRSKGALGGFRGSGGLSKTQLSHVFQPLLSPHEVLREPATWPKTRLLKGLWWFLKVAVWESAWSTTLAAS